MTSTAQPSMSSTCPWRTGVYQCKLLPTAGKYCQWHQYWLRLVDAGNLGRQQREEFMEWREQFQPYGIYAYNPGQWWADGEVVWAALTGVGEAPRMTEAIASELLLRRAEVRRYQQGQAWEHNPWARVDGSPLPEWSAEAWKRHVLINGSSLAIQQ
jgi:hypothetical protein